MDENTENRSNSQPPPAAEQIAATANDEFWTQLLGQEVVLDLASPFVMIGQLCGLRDGFLELAAVDVHDLRDTQTTREKYVLDCRLHGPRSNRARAWISLRDVVAISRLADVQTD